MNFKRGAFPIISRVIFLLYANTVILTSQSQSNGETHYANLYGTEPFNSTPIENVIGTGVGIIEFAYNLVSQLKENQPDATPEPNSRYDFVVVGAGTAGATVASRLTEISNVTVMLIEAGPEETLDMDIPSVAAALEGRADINWNYTTEPSDKYCRGMIDHNCGWARGKVMGGCSTTNYMIATRANPKDYDHWAELGNDGWAFKDVLKYFKKLENIQIPELRADTQYHGTNGPVTIDYSPFKSPLATTFLKAGQELGYPLVDYNGEKQIGFSRVQSTMYQGYRMSSNRAYLRNKRRANLHVSKHSMVQKVLINKENKQATGVQFIKNGRLISVYANKEVILCAGAIGSPQILMLSGIGPAKHLQELGIDVVKNSSVGDNLMDHISYGGLTFTLREPVSINAYNLKDITQPYLKDFLLYSKGPYAATGGSEGIAFLDVDNPNSRDGIPNIEILSWLGSLYSEPGSGTLGLNPEITSKNLWLQATYSWGAYALILRPKSRGWIRLKSNNVNVKPMIVPNYMSDPDDVRLLIKGIRTILEISRTKAMQELGLEFYNETVSECEQYPFDSDEYWECNLRTITSTIYHYSGTCKMGPESDDTAVVDSTLKVYGVKGLRVADASIMPRITSGHTNIPTYMIAEKLSDMVRKEWGYPTDTDDSRDLNNMT